jgi:VanZ family protein
MAAITTLSLWPAAHLPTVPGTDKTHHFIAYAALILPTALQKPKNYLLLVLTFITFSGMIELIQPYVNRYGEWLDMLANTLGLFFGWLLAKTLLHCYQKHN